MNKKWLYIILLFISLFGITYGAYLYTATSNNIQIGTSLTNTNSTFKFTPLNYSNTSNEYINQNKRQYFTTGEFTSEVYGTFVPDGRIDLIKNTGVNSNCTGESVSYYFQGNFKHLSAGSDAWGKGYRIEVDPINNYYCPDSGKFSVKLVSRETDTFFDTMVISNIINPTYLTVTVKDSRGNDITLDERVLFSNAKLQIGGIINTNSTISEEFTGGTSTQKELSNLQQLNYNNSSGVGNLTQFMTNIKKNINSQTKGMTWLTTNTSRSSLQSLMLYNFEGIENSSASNVNNKGKILRLNNIGNGLRVNGENTLIIKGGNLYIQDDIYSVNNTDILTIIVLRDETNKINGGNIYIDPNVTNIDAIIISEGSVMSYNGTQVIDSTTHTNNLKRQLFIYGNLITRNTIGQNKAIFNTDDYITSGSEISSNKYNLENLRSFQMVKSNQITSPPCNDPNKITAMGVDETTSITEAFAGKKNCYFDGDTKGNLRSTHRTASTVIEYNPNIQVNSPKIIRVY